MGERIRNDLDAHKDALQLGYDAYTQWLEELEKEIKYDLSSKAIALLTCLSAYGPDPQNLMFKGDSSIGKTWIATNVVRYFPEQDVWMLGGLSPTSLVHDKGILEEAQTGERLDENWINKTMTAWRKDNPDATRDEEKQKFYEVREIWEEIEKKYVVDLSSKILLFLEAPHIETFNRLRPILSHDAHEITYKFTDSGKDKSLTTQTVTLRGWPATIFCTTDKTWMEDLATRSFTVQPATSKEKLAAAIKLIARKGSRPWLFRNNKINKFSEYVKYVKDELLKNWMPIIPYNEELGAMTEPVLGRDMRDFKHISTLINTMALLHFNARPKIVFGEDKYVLATIQDWEYVLEIWRDVEKTTRTGLTADEMFLYECLKTVEATNSFPTMELIVDEYNKHVAKKVSSKLAYKYLENLRAIGFIDKHKDDRNKQEYADADARQNIYHIIERDANILFKAGEFFQHFFGLEDLEKWFIDLKKLFPPKHDFTHTQFH